MMAPYEHLFAQMALRLTRGEVAPFFFGDNLNGYFEGRTFRTAAGDGYIEGDHTLLLDVRAGKGRQILRRERATGATLYPWGIRHDYPGGAWESLSLLHRRRALALQVNAPRAAQLWLEPIAATSGAAWTVGPRNQGLVRPARPEGDWMAAASPQAFAVDATGLRLQTCGREKTFLLYLAFGRTEREALASAGRLLAEDALAMHQVELHDVLTRSRIETGDEKVDRALLWAKLSSYFMVVESFGKGIWAGLPWFRDNWGRDTFIALPGTLLATGLFGEAKEVIRNFLRYQNTDPASVDFGRVPNRVCGPRDIIYNTTDGTPWLIREILEYLDYTGDLPLAREVYPAVCRALDGALRHHVDAEGFLTHDDADTWMDARIEGRAPWSPRGNRANDIQALWFTALLAGAELARLNRDRSRAARWRNLARRVQKAFPRRFWDGRRMADRIDAAGVCDFRVRPNQLMLLTVPRTEPFLADNVAERVMRNAVGELLFPHGICSLSPRDPQFHPYHDGRREYHKDAAYHNGTIWGWNAGFAVSALCARGQERLAWKLYENLADQILHLGCRGTMSELLDAWPDERGRIKPSGTWSQAWSTAEFVRNAHQDFGGFRPRLTQGAVDLAPRLPAACQRHSATHAFGSGGRLTVSYARGPRRQGYVIRLDGQPSVLLRFDFIAWGRRFCGELALEDGDLLTVLLEREGCRIGLNGQSVGASKGELHPQTEPLRFARPSRRKKPPALRQQDYLRHLVLSAGG